MVKTPQTADQKAKTQRKIQKRALEKGAQEHKGPTLAEMWGGPKKPERVQEPPPHAPKLGTKARLTARSTRSKLRSIDCLDEQPYKPQG